jgi:hypothetical protein
MTTLNPKEYLTDWLTDRSATGPQARRLRREGYHYAGISDFLLLHGVWYTPVPFPAGIKKGRARHCFRNALVLATAEPDYRYVEGYALAASNFPVHHAWNLDRDGNLFDRTWKNSGTACRGVVFSFERASASDYPVLDDPKSRFAIFREPWTGEK